MRAYFWSPYLRAYNEVHLYTFSENKLYLSRLYCAVKFPLLVLPFSEPLQLFLFRVLFKLSDYEGSLIAYKKIVKPDFQSLVGLALACNKAGHFEEAYNAYKGSLSMASDDGERSHVLAAMATIAYKFQVRILLNFFVYIFWFLNYLHK